MRISNFLLYRLVNYLIIYQRRRVQEKQAFKSKQKSLSDKMEL